MSLAHLNLRRRRESSEERKTRKSSESTGAPTTSSQKHEKKKCMVDQRTTFRDCKVEARQSTGSRWNGSSRGKSELWRDKMAKTRVCDCQSVAGVKSDSNRCPLWLSYWSCLAEGQTACSRCSIVSRLRTSCLCRDEETRMAASAFVLEDAFMKHRRSQELVGGYV